jgi:SOS-response transcriptional repressor LexA
MELARKSLKISKVLVRNVKLPLFATAVSCGFPSPAEDYIDNVLDLNDLLIQKPAATFFVRAKGDSMVNAGIYEGDLLIIDRSINPKSGHIVLALEWASKSRLLLKIRSTSRLTSLKRWHLRFGVLLSTVFTR